MSHKLEIPDSLYAALKEAADASGSPQLIGLPPTCPKPRDLKGQKQHKPVVPKHSRICSRVESDVSGVVVRSGCLRIAGRNLRTLWKRSGEQDTCDPR